MTLRYETSYLHNVSICQCCTTTLVSELSFQVINAVPFLKIETEKVDDNIKATKCLNQVYLKDQDHQDIGSEGSRHIHQPNGQTCSRKQSLTTTIEFMSKNNLHQPLYWIKLSHIALPVPSSIPKAVVHRIATIESPWYSSS